MRKAEPQQQASSPTGENIEAIAKLEHDALKNRALSERVTEAIVRVIGSVGFLFFNLFLISAWTLINLNLIPGLRSFDPFPFGALALAISSESVFLTIFVLMSQNRILRQSDRRSHLDLQISLLTEQELTTVLLMLEKLCQHAGVNVESSMEAVKGFAKATDIHELATELKEKLPEQH